MKTAARLTCVAVLAVLALAGTLPTSQAKGPTDVVVAGPGIDDVHLTFTEPADDVDAGTLGDASEIYEMWDAGRLGRAPDLSADELGPRYVLTWTADAHGGEDVDDSGDVVVQHAYPFAEGGGWVEFPRDQVLWGSPIASGWVAAPRLLTEMVRLGATAETSQPALAEPAPSVAAADAAARTPVGQDDDVWPSYRVAVAAGVLLAAAVVVCALIARRRRLSP